MNDSQKIKLGAKELRTSQPTKSDLAKIKRREIYIICDSILDTFNIGSIFRLADAVAAKCVYLCGETAVPPNERIAKAAVGTEKWVPWQYVGSAVEAIQELRRRHSHVHPRGVKESSKVHPEGEQSLMVVAIEQGKNSEDFRKVDFREPVAFVIGHETTGVSKDALKACDFQAEIPMFGVNKSLNVMVSLAIILYKTIESFKIA